MSIRLPLLPVAAVYFSYRYLGVSSDAALGMAVVQHVCYFLPLAGIGYLVLTKWQFRWEKGPARLR